MARYLTTRVLTVIWSALALAYAGVRLPGTIAALGAGSFRPGVTFHTTDLYFENCAGMLAGSEAVEKVIKSIQSADPIVVFYQETNPESSLLGMLVRYIGWPRVFVALPVDSPTTSKAARPLTANAAMFFCRVAPPPGVDAIVLGRGFWFASHRHVE